MAQIAFLFPGQGAQAVGMGEGPCAATPTARRLFEQASECLGYDLAETCRTGPAERLNSTAVSQPAILVASLAALEVLREQSPESVEGAAAAAGLSLGEYTALVFAEALDFRDALEVVKARGEAMQSASDANAGGMVSILGLEQSQVEEICSAARDGRVLELANLLCPANYVVSGHIDACERAEQRAREVGGRTVRLAVAGAFHTSLMRPADETLARALERVEIRAPRVPVWSNVDARPHTDPEEIRRLLVAQVVRPVLWEETMRGILNAGANRFYEVGPGRVLAGLLKRVQRKTEIHNVTA